MIENKKVKFYGKIALIIGAFSAAAVVIFALPNTVEQGIANGLKISAAVIIPALFPFTVAAVFFEKSGGIDYLGYIFLPSVQRLFLLNGSCLAVVIISIIGGYPTGAKLIDALYRSGNIDRFTARRMLLFCTHAGPTFYLSIIGKELFCSQKIGLILFVCNILSTFLLAFFSRFWAKAHYKKRPPKNGFGTFKENACPKKPALSPAESFVEAVREAAGSLFGICAWVVLFAAITAVVEAIFKNALLCFLLNAVIEVTNGCLTCFKYHAPLYVYAAILSFSGFSVLFQVQFTAASVRPEILRLTLFGVIRGLCSAGLTALYFTLFPQTVACLSGGAAVTVGYHTTLQSVLLLAFLGAFLLYTSLIFGKKTNSYI